MTDIESYLVTEFCNTWRVLKATNTDLEAHKIAINALLDQYPNLREFLDARLVSARQSPALLETMNSKYGLTLETWLRKLPDAPEGLVRKMLETLEGLE